MSVCQRVKQTLDKTSNRDFQMFHRLSAEMDGDMLPQLFVAWSLWHQDSKFRGISPRVRHSRLKTPLFFKGNSSNLCWFPNCGVAFICNVGLSRNWPTANNSVIRPGWQSWVVAVRQISGRCGRLQRWSNHDQLTGQPLGKGKTERNTQGPKHNNQKLNDP